MRIVFCGDCGASLQALNTCSACAGDYEDPDRTAWTAETEEDETQDWAENEAGDERLIEQGVEDDEFPAKEA